MNNFVREPAPVRTYSIGELAALYGVSNRTFARWRKAQFPHLQPTGRMFPPKAVTEIFSILGRPEVKRRKPAA